MAAALHTTDASFKKDVLESDIPVLVDFWAEWCPPCRMISPVMEELAKEYEGKLKVAKVNADENPRVSMDYQVRGIPTLLFFKNGKVVKQFVGAAARAKYEAEIKEILKPSRT